MFLSEFLPCTPHFNMSPYNGWLFLCSNIHIESTNLIDSVRTVNIAKNESICCVSAYTLHLYYQKIEKMKGKKCIKKKLFIMKNN